MKSTLHLHLMSPSKLEIENPVDHKSFVVFKDKKSIEKLITIKYSYAERNKVLLEIEHDGNFTYCFLDFFKTSSDGETFFYIEKLSMPKDEHKKYAPRFKFGEPE